MQNYNIIYCPIKVINLVCHPKAVAIKLWCAPPWRDAGLSGKLHSKGEFVIILKISQIDCLISWIYFRNTTLTAERSLGSNKSFLQSLHRFHGLKSNVTNSSCSF
jgi:hypothetical protein